MNARLLALVVAPLLVTTACGGDSDSPTSAGPPADGDYIAADLPGNFTSHDRVRLTVDGDTLSFQASCNTFSGTAAWADGQLRATDLSATEMGCPPALRLQDEWLADFFGGEPDFVLADGGVTLTSGEDTLDFRPRSEVDPARPLEGTGWTLKGVGKDGADKTVTSVPVRSTLVIRDGTVTLQPGCNSGSGPVEVSDGELTFGDIAVTLKGCVGEREQVEEQVLRVLQGTVSYAIDASQLTITGADGTTLMYTAAD